ncbi:lymphocyte cytosolic protein 2-like [Scleropages formosus]|uniref:lymphocyte cytosolic protein 2-like n=1 Tax=Scleropages formosus TaxID=113540 RepID=UPI0010FA9CEA|nr:lymphocyte cytosolic protein 2-like [Scleropages formosus]
MPFQIERGVWWHNVPQRPSQVQAVRTPGPGPSVSRLSVTNLGVPSPRRSQPTPFKPPAHSAPKVDRSTKPEWLKDSLCKDLQYPSYPSLSETKPGGTVKDLDPSWYLGQVTRGYAESYLRRVRKDGAFLVRDSSTSSPTQPYTLMVLYQDKVYNIQIRYNSDQRTFSLGTGLNTIENFRNVGTIIQHHMQIPLNLIDANYHEPRRHCPLLYPAVLQ